MVERPRVGLNRSRPDPVAERGYTPIMVLVVMGVSGCGKTTVGKRLAERLGCPFQEGDRLHPPANVAKMAAGRPLDDADRGPWLAAVADWIDARRAAGGGGVISCSALKRAYREILIGARPDVRLIYLRGDSETIHRRLADRIGHFMPASLLASQLATLEEPLPGERPIVVAIDRPPDEIVALILDQLDA
jgi:carbohydrate kinase (thermoresistant glucokinase family)